MSRTICIVQARMASTRLPGKVLLDLAGRPVLEHVLTRCRAIPSVDEVCCATATSSDCDGIAGLAESLGCMVFRGDPLDVLKRYRQAADLAGADVVLRVTSDCPLIDPAVCEATLRLRASANAAYASNNRRPEWPHGVDCEAFTIAALRQADERSIEPECREHVTYWITDHSDLPVVHLSGPGTKMSRHRWTVDWPEDLAFLRALSAHLPPWPALPGWQEVAAVLEACPELSTINACRIGHPQQ